MRGGQGEGGGGTFFVRQGDCLIWDTGGGRKCDQNGLVMVVVVVWGHGKLGLWAGKDTYCKNIPVSTQNNVFVAWVWWRSWLFITSCRTGSGNVIEPETRPQQVKWAEISMVQRGSSNAIFKSQN